MLQLARTRTRTHSIRENKCNEKNGNPSQLIPAPQKTHFYKIRNNSFEGVHSLADIATWMISALVIFVLVFHSDRTCDGRHFEVQSNNNHIQNRIFFHLFCVSAVQFCWLHVIRAVSVRTHIAIKNNNTTYFTCKQLIYLFCAFIFGWQR